MQKERVPGQRTRSEVQMGPVWVPGGQVGIQANIVPFWDSGHGNPCAHRTGHMDLREGGKGCVCGGWR